MIGRYICKVWKDETQEEGKNAGGCEPSMGEH